MNRAALLSLIALVVALAALAGCGEATVVEEGLFDDESNVLEQGLVVCNPHSDTGYRSGTPFAITVITVDGRPVEAETARAYVAMQQAAGRAGVALRVVSGFRTMAEQERLYTCYTTCSCNNCNQAAYPGTSNHQSGSALDLNTSSPGVLAWLNGHARAHGFRRTVPSEAWHWEWDGTGPRADVCGTAPAPAFDCNEACGKFGCACVDGACSGGYCPGTGCTDQETRNCAAFGVNCVDHQCQGGYGEGSGCTARETLDCAAFGCGCVDHKCNGGACDGTGCTARETLNCGGFGVNCVDHQCSGGYGPGTGCTARETANCAAFGVNCVDHQCAGGYGPGSGCTARETLDCGNVGCGCVDHHCSGGFCPGTGCTARQTLDCEAQGKGCANGACK